MTIGSDNPYPSVLLVEGTTPASPAAGRQRLFVRSSDHAYCTVNSSGTVTAVGGAGGAMATDTLWDALGDLAVGTGANTGAKLTIGTTGQVLTVAGGTATWATPAGGGGGSPDDQNNVVAIEVYG